MLRQLHSARPALDVRVVVPISKGGTGASTVQGAVDNLGAIPKSWLGRPNGILMLDENGLIPVSAADIASDIRGQSIDGPLIVQHGSRTQYRVTAVNLFDGIQCTVSAGASVEIGENSVYVTAPGYGSSMTMVLNGRRIIIGLVPTGVTPPTIITPSVDSTMLPTFTFRSSKMEDSSLRYSNYYPLSTELLSVPTRAVAVELDGSEGEQGLVEISFGGKTYGIGKAETNRVVYLNGATEVSAVVTGSAKCDYRWIVSDRVHYSSDWVVARDVSFTDVVFSSTDDRVNLTSLSLYLPQGDYYAKVRYNAVDYQDPPPPPEPEPEVPVVARPVVTWPLNGVYLESWPAVFASSEFTLSNAGATDIHSRTDWQVATNSDFTNIVQSSIESPVDLTSWTVSNLTYQTTYYVRVRHYGVAAGMGPWSEIVTFQTVEAPPVPVQAVVVKPSITVPAADLDNHQLSQYFASSGFLLSQGSGQHLSSDWEIATDAAFTNIVAQVTGSASDLVRWRTQYRTTAGTKLYVRVRYNAESVV